MRLVKFTALWILLALGLARPAQADEKKGTKPPPQDDSASLFEALGGGLSDTGKGLGDLIEATDEVGPAEKKRPDGLTVRKKAVAGDGKVTVVRVFAAPKIVFVKGQCEAKPHRVKFFVAPEFPFDAERFSVCARLAGGALRSMRMSVSITTGRGKVVGSAETIADFTGKTQIDHTLSFPALVFPEPGVYRYIIDIEGERIANLPLFEVRPDDKQQDEGYQ